MEDFEVLPKTIEPNIVPIDNQSSGSNASSGGQNVSANTPTGGVTSSAPQQVFNIQKLSEITGDLGDIVAGTITMPASGYIRAGQNTYNNGAGFFLGYSPSALAHQLSIGDGTTANSLTWDGTNLRVGGYLLSGKGAFGGDGSDGALSVSSGTTTLNLGGASVFIKNYTSISITGTGAIDFSNPAAAGTIVIFKSQGAVTITSSATRAIDLRGIGGGEGSWSANSSNGTAGGSGGAASPGGGGGGGGATEGAGTAGSAGTGGGTNGSGGTAGGQITLRSSFFNQRRKALFTTTGHSGAAGGVGKNGSNLTDGAAGTAGVGGGALTIECAGALNVTGTIDASGTAGGAGGNGTVGPGGGGGGGGGGTIYILYNTLTANSGTFTVSGGSGGAGGVKGALTGGAGGAGATGYSLVEQNVSFP